MQENIHFIFHLNFVRSKLKCNNFITKKHHTEFISQLHLHSAAERKNKIMNRSTISKVYKPSLSSLRAFPQEQTDWWE